MRDDLTDAEIEAGKSRKGGFTRETLEGWGVPWPPPAGWRDALTAKERAAKRDAGVARGQIKRATLIADASVSRRSRVGGWAAWIKTGPAPGRIYSGAFKVPVESSFDAEAMALANGIAIAIHHGLFEGVELVMLQSDNLPVLGLIAAHVADVVINDAKTGGAAITPGKRAPKPLDRVSALAADAVRRIEKHSRASGFKIEVRHVKGHAQDRPDAVGRHNVNALCDQAAKAARKTAERMQQIEKGIQR